MSDNLSQHASQATPLPCPVCGAGIPADAPNGMCPRCLLAEGVSAEEVLPSVAETLGGPDRSGASVNRVLPTHLRYLGDYELLEEIARGGMGVVYRARQASLSRTVAVKMILAGSLADESAVRRFRQEAAAAAALDHPHIVPIYEVGDQNGQHYFSMGYVPGSSLAERLKNGPLPAKEAAQLVLTIAEAVQYAHEQGVIHRDLKPANILLDEAGRPRVTDFGLAKVATQDQSLTKTGQAVGTPGYMPPEQVQNGEIGPTADVYALGAILYALLTGRPPFQAATPLDTMLQVIAAEPASPRTLNPAVPRDLETIALKCLEKRTEWRYRTALELANELKKFLAGEPIAARPPGLIERGSRWLGKQRQGVLLVLAAIAASFLALVSGSWVFNLYHESQQGQLLLHAPQHARPAATVFDSQGKEALPAFTVPTLQPVTLPAQEYRVRAGDGYLLSDDFLLSVTQGQTSAYELSLLPSQLIPDQTIPGTWSVVHTRGRESFAHWVLCSEQEIELRDVREAGRNWRFSAEGNAELQKIPGFRLWPWENNSHAPSGIGNYDFRPRAVPHPPQLDAGPLRDIIIAYRHQPIILAISADTGKLLWCYSAEGFPTLDYTKFGNQPNYRPYFLGSVIGLPIVVPDIDADGTDDLVAALMEIEKGSEWNQRPRRTIEAISSRTGKRLWRHDLPDENFVPPPGTEPAEVCRWTAGPPNGGGGGGSVSAYYGNVVRSSTTYKVSRNDEVIMPWPPRLNRETKTPQIECVAGRELVALDLQTGKPIRAAFDLGFMPSREPQWADVDGDRLPEAIFVETIGPSSGALHSPGKVRLHVRAGISGELLWPPREQFADYERHSGHFHALPQWPLVEDLNGDGRAEIISPHETSTDFSGTPAERSFRAWGGLEAVDGQTGQPLWQQRLQTADQQTDQLLVGPDINGDGWREVFVATLFARQVFGAQLYVDALSGKDGSRLWTNRVPVVLMQLENEVIGTLLWWTAGPDGWPQLCVPVLESSNGRPLGLTIFSAGTGQVTRSSVGLGTPELADLDGDGLDDLISLQLATERIVDLGGKLHVFRGTSPQPWRTLGRRLQAADDYDSDGREDALISRDRSFGPRTAVSGRNGRVLWQHVDVDQSGQYYPLHADLNGDGVADFAGVDGERGNPGEVSPVRLFSGKTGQLLWNAGFGVRVMSDTLHVAARDLDHDRQPELVLIAGMDLDFPATSKPSGNDWQVWLIVLNGQTGTVRIKQRLTETEVRNAVGNATELHPAYADLNGDGCEDVIVPLLDLQEQPHLLALNGRGAATTLWQIDLHLGDAVPGYARIDSLPRVQIGDLNGDSLPDLVFNLTVRKPPIDGKEQGSVQVCALAGRTGAALPGWPWELTSDKFPFATKTTIEIDGGPDSHRYRSRPTLVKLGDDQRPALFTWFQGERNTTPGQLLLIAADGKLLWQQNVEPSSSNRYFRPWVGELNGDGRDDCVVINKHSLEGYDLTTQQRIWQRAVSQDGAEILGLEPATEQTPPIVIVAEGRTLQGISGRDGSLVWRSAGLPEPYSTFSSPWQLLRDSRPGSLPLVLRAEIHTDAICRGVELLQNDAGFTPQRIAVKANGNAATFRDPRFARVLPWTEPGRQPLQLESPAYLASGFVFAFLLLIVPGWALRQVLWQRRFSLGFLLLLPAVIGLVIVGLQLPVPQQPYGETSFRARWTIALQMGMVLLALYLLGRWAWLRQWQKLGLAAIATGSVTVSMAVVYLLRNPLSPGEYFLYDQWWEILIFGGFVATPVIIVGSQIQALAQFLRAQRLRGQQQPGPPSPAE